MPSAALTAELRSTEHELLERARRQRLAAPDRQEPAGPAEDDIVDVEALRALAA